MNKSRVLSIVLVLVLLMSCVAFAAPTPRVQQSDITYRSIKININGTEIAPCDVNGNPTEPFILNSDSSTYLPVRAVAAALGLDVDWDDPNSTVVLKTGGQVKTYKTQPAASNGVKKASLTYRNIKITMDGREIALVNEQGAKVEPFIYNESTYLPVRAVASALGLEISWDDPSSTVIMNDNSKFHISVQPRDASFINTKTTTFSVEVKGGTAPYAYQWYSASPNSTKWTKISKATNSTLKYTTFTKALQLKCEITDKNGEKLESNVANFTEDQTAMTITLQPESQLLRPGETVVFSVAVEGGQPPYNYQWYTAALRSKSWTALSGETAATLKLTNVSDEKQIKCIITDNKKKTITSDIVDYGFGDYLAIATQPRSTTAEDGAKVSFSVKAKGGNGTYTYQWYFIPASSMRTSGNVISKATSETYTISSCDYADDAGQYYCIVTDNKGKGDSVTSEKATLTIKDPNALAVKTNPESKTVDIGATVTFTAAGERGKTPYSYAWQISSNNKNWDYIKGADKDTLTLESVSEDDAAYYRCVITENSSFNRAVVYTSAAQLTVNKKAAEPVPDPEPSPAPVEDTTPSAITPAE